MTLGAGCVHDTLKGVVYPDFLLRANGFTFQSDAVQGEPCVTLGFFNYDLLAGKKLVRPLPVSLASTVEGLALDCDVVEIETFFQASLFGNDHFFVFWAVDFCFALYAYRRNHLNFWIINRFTFIDFFAICDKFVLLLHVLFIILVDHDLLIFHDEITAVVIR